MSVSAGRVGAVIRKELAEFRRNRLIVGTAAMLPLVFLVAPTASILTVKASAVSAGLGNGIDRSLFLPLLVPVFVPAVLNAYSVVGEREQGTPPGRSGPAWRSAWRWPGCSTASASSPGPSPASRTWTSHPASPQGPVLERS